MPNCLINNVSLKSIVKYNKIEETLSKHLKSNNIIMGRLKREKDEFDKVKTSILKIKQNFIKKSLDQLLINRTKQRYSNDFNNVVEEQAQIEVDLKIRKLSEELEQYAIRKRDDTYISACKLDVYKIRMKIQDLSDWYANKDDETNEKRQILLSNIEKLRRDTELKKNRLVLYKKAIGKQRIATNSSLKDLQDIDMALFPKKYAIENKSPTTSMITLFELKDRTLHANSLDDIKSTSKTPTD